MQDFEKKKILNGNNKWFNSLNVYKKTAQWVLFGVGILALILVVFIAVAPVLINLEAVRGRIIAEISSKINGNIDFQRIRLSYLPTPHVEISQLRLSTPESLNGTLDHVTVYPKIGLLFTGKIQISKISAKSPDFNITLPASDSKARDTRRQPGDPGLEEKIAAFVGSLNLISDDLLAILEKGHLQIASKDWGNWDFSGMYIRLQMLRGKIKVDIRSASSLFKKLNLKGEIDLEESKASGNLKLTELKPQILTSQFIPFDMIEVGESKINMGLSFEIDRLNVIKGEVEIPLIHLAMQRGKEEVILKGTVLKSTFYIHKDNIRLAFQGLNIEHPRLKLSGAFLIDPSSRKAKLELNGTNVDVASVRESALALAGDRSTVKDIFDILKGGQIPALNFVSAGKSLSDLGEFPNMTIKGSILNGKVHVPEVNLTMENVKGNLVIARGILDAEDIKARYGETRVKDGTLRLGLTGKNAPFHLDIGLTADLSKVQSVLKKVLNDGVFVTVLNRIENLRGRSNGRLILGEKLDAIDAVVKVHDVDLTANVTQLHFPLKVKGNGLSFAGKSLKIKRLNGEIKNSKFSLFSVGVNWDKLPTVNIRSGKADIHLHEIYSWLASTKRLGKALKYLNALDGVAKLATLRLKGPLFKPLEWSFETAGQLENVIVKSHMLPEALFVKDGTFLLTPQEVTIADIEAQNMDASLKMAGKLEGYLERVENLELKFSGNVGEKAYQWLINHVKLRPYLLLHAPLVVSDGRFTLDRKGRRTFSGIISTHKDLHVTSDILLEAGKLIINKLVIQDRDSQASFTAKLGRKEISFSFKGNLQKSTVDKLLSQDQISVAWLKGDLQAIYYPDRLMECVFNGNLRGKDFVLIKGLDIPVKIDTFSIEGRGDNFHLESDVHFEQDKALKLVGDFNYSPNGIFFDAAMTSDGLELDKWVTKLKRNQRGKEKNNRARFWDFPLEGNLKLDSAYLKYKQYALHPFHADIYIHPERIRVSTRDAKLCGISLPGTLVLMPQEIELDFKPTAQDQELIAVGTCLLIKDSELEGRFNFNGEISGRGAMEDLVRVLKGNFELNATKGRFFAGPSFEIIKDILAVINITEIYKGKLPDLGKEGFGFDSIRTKVGIKNNTMVIEEAILKAQSLTITGNGKLTLNDKNIDIKLLAAPFKTIDSVVGLIPILGDIMGGSLVAVPVRISGNLNQPSISILELSDVGEGVVGMMKRTLNFPVKIMKPVFSSKDE